MSDNKALPPAILLMGPTASGKTDLAMALSERLPCDLISVDSVMVYRGMDIGSAKPDPDTLTRYPHHLIDIRDPAEPYSAAEFRTDALRLMEQSVNAGRIPLLVGGTIMYYKALCQGLGDMPSADENVRGQILAEAEQVGWPALHEQLRQVDPVAAAKIHPNNRQRIQRALEVYRLTGKPLSHYWAADGANPENELNWDSVNGAALPYNALNLALAPVKREDLHARIAKRFQIMLEQGMIDEVEQLRRRGDLNVELPSIRAVGYRQVWSYLEGEFGREEMVEKATAATRQLAKRQMTWLRSWPEINWLSADDTQLVEAAMRLISQRLQSCNPL
ncbi:tRNA delta(2)-isopentenylpyrophosphate transferase [Hahella chejuensis KCTC 2396]|uniref:tRNA dimethylallyltransferase 2 n=1 Tax=Hahella chejuensis (strain KCTC 2396) TaxID=349521 RepID=MIAA2_HAHCH|nr:tRNA (adenosine(37)-N6)-dimethylallyltransferase MiaA [Hahella chejuensis]Q2SBC1.1 RecName: Full=tRNA dimethylallyltransferase 2; AltName: Full=Dimethylallyl diphosphate:tRNA dimethylallyltransferase 2; Short=DMAPP:tRNA dimethylallyltransferase 2; Short=DMATase 2; AltName: Full=Isopentenyl-diphosphate:tRNA isopentenyltransferase 2; Short=IPP transferase 2; Short=IPPT 2; Short=IPTase 2 [Hahella chejuensis KCTC 2396]ABC32053.1 tRNA delta(2)-isopentenylpyrophosphate transferase [Hahella chejuensi